MSDNVKCDIRNKVLHIEFNRPKKKNAITTAMYQKMADALTKAEDDQEVRAIAFKGAEGCFTSGNDIGD